MTPSPSETGAGVEASEKGATSADKGKKRRGKNLVELLSTPYDGFKYSDWVGEFNLTVSNIDA